MVPIPLRNFKINETAFYSYIYIFYISFYRNYMYIAVLSLLIIAKEIKLFCIIRNEEHIYMQIFSAVSYTKYIYFFQLSDLGEQQIR